MIRTSLKRENPHARSPLLITMPVSLCAVDVIVGAVQFMCTSVNRRSLTLSLRWLSPCVYVWVQVWIRTYSLGFIWI